MEANSQSKTVLIVEDEKNIVDILRFNLQREGYRTVEAYDGADGLAKARSENPDIILLDVMLPKMIGFDVCRTLREEGNNVPVIILTAREEEADKVLGLEIGADDYITKPFSVSELLARIEALCRRVNRGKNQPAAKETRLVSGKFVLDEASRILYKGETPIDLTQVEFQIMELFFRNQGTALVREKILEGVWGPGYFGDVKIVDVNIRRLRMKIEDEPSSPKHILTVWGYGYRWNA